MFVGLDEYLRFKQTVFELLLLFIHLVCVCVIVVACGDNINKYYLKNLHNIFTRIANVHNNIRTCYECKSTLTECRIRIDAFQWNDRRNAWIVE